MRAISSIAVKKLAVQFVLDNIDYRKRCLYLQEIIYMSRANDVWRKALASFFDTPLNLQLANNFSQN